MGRRHPNSAAPWLAALVSVVGCADVFGPELPGGAIRLDPVPVEYRTWWALAQTCSGLQARLEDVAWWRVPGEETIPGSDDAAGQYFRRAHAVVLAEGQERSGALVRHEMLHALLSTRNVSGHPKHFFEVRCGGVVSCGDQCQQEVGGPIPPTLVVPDGSDSLAVTLQIFYDSLPRRHAARPCLAFLVAGTNTRSTPVRVEVGNIQYFRWRIEGWGGGSGGGPVRPNDVVFLAPGASIHEAYDCPEPISVLPPGEYTAQGQIHSARSDRKVFMIRP